MLNKAISKGSYGRGGDKLRIGRRSGSHKNIRSF